MLSYHIFDMQNLFLCSAKKVTNSLGGLLELEDQNGQPEKNTI